jgi:hypothetical protein
MTDRPIDVDVDPRVELAEKGPDFERRVGEPARVRNRPDPTAAELAEEDVLIERRDLGPESSTFIAAGDPIPAELRDLPRRAARPAPRKKVGRGLVGPVGLVPGRQP